MIELVSLFGAAALMVAIVGFYCIMTTRNLIRTLIGVEVLGKAGTLLIVLAGYAVGQPALGQALAITMIIIEVSVTVVAVGLVLCVHREHGSIESSLLKEIKG